MELELTQHLNSTGNLTFNAHLNSYSTEILIFLGMAYAIPMHTLPLSQWQLASPYVCSIRVFEHK